MAYNDNIPAANDLISTSQGQIQANFQAIDSTVFGFAREHVALTDGTNGGLHKKVTLQLQSVDPAANAADVILYNKQVGYTGGVNRNELFMRQSSADGSAVIQLTDLFKAINNGSTGSTFLPGGLVIKWGQLTFTGTSGSSTFAGAFNTTAQVVVASPFNVNAANSNWYVSTWNASSLTINTVGAVASASFTYIAIGV